MPILILARGLPASGKTTAARAYVALAPERRRMINRDRLRFALFGKHSGLNPEDEGLVTQVEMVQISHLLRQGLDVFVDDTNLNDKTLVRLMEVAEDCGCEHIIQDFPISVDEAIRRDYARGLRGEPWVGEAVIRRMAEQRTAPLIPSPRRQPSSAHSAS